MENIEINYAIDVVSFILLVNKIYFLNRFALCLAIGVLKGAVVLRKKKFGYGSCQFPDARVTATTREMSSDILTAF